MREIGVDSYGSRWTTTDSCGLETANEFVAAGLSENHRDRG
jgi:hypothetical protein